MITIPDDIPSFTPFISFLLIAAIYNGDFSFFNNKYQWISLSIIATILFIIQTIQMNDLFWAESFVAWIVITFIIATIYIFFYEIRNNTLILSAAISFGLTLLLYIIFIDIETYINLQNDLGSSNNDSLLLDVHNWGIIFVRTFIPNDILESAKSNRQSHGIDMILKLIQIIPYVIFIVLALLKKVAP